MMAKMTFRIWILVIVLLLSLLAISPSFTDGVLIKSVEKNSTAYDSGLRAGMIIKSINGVEVSNVADYSKVLGGLFSDNAEKKITISTKDSEFIILTDHDLNMTVRDKPRTKIKTGLDLQGGARALVQPEVTLDSEQLDDLIDVTSNRLNVFGISDVAIRPVTDLSGNKYMLIEVAGAAPSDIRDLVSKQGKFEAKIGNDTVFVSGSDDIKDVCRFDATCSGIRSCGQQADSTYACQFAFVVYLSPEAAQRHADITSKLKIDTTQGGRYLEKKLDLLIDDVITDSLLISDGLRGQVTTEISVQGSGFGLTQEEAFSDATESMNKLQTIMITGSLPYKLNIVKLDSLSPTLGHEFENNILILAIVVFVIVSTIIMVKYRKIKLTLSVILTMFSEAFITLGVAALIGWNLDAPSIAGIIAGMGTGVNDQIILLSESTAISQRSIRERIKGALFVIFAAFSTILVAMIPLFWTGAGLLKGFAFTTIVSISIGILITRPAFADIIRNISSDS
jgi:preprotein translocase subunit SecD